LCKKGVSHHQTSPLEFSIIPLFASTKYVKFTPMDINDVKQQLDAVTQIITETVPVESIYLFGSYAYGTPNKDSDLDLYIVFKDEMPMRELEAIRSIRMAIDPVKNMSMDILGLKQNRFHDRKLYATLERKIVREGIKLYG